MPDRQPDEPAPADFKEAAKRSEEANIADESASYTNAIEDAELKNEGERTKRPTGSTKANQ